jgi:hypothetical protein
MKKLDDKEFKDQTKIFFKNTNNKFEHPFSIYLDFESTLKSCDELEDKPKNAEKFIFLIVVVLNLIAFMMNILNQLKLSIIQMKNYY